MTFLITVSEARFGLARKEAFGVTDIQEEGS